MLTLVIANKLYVPHKLRFWEGWLLHANTCSFREQIKEKQEWERCRLATQKHLDLKLAWYVFAQEILDYHLDR